VPIANITCPSCNRAVAVETFLSACSEFWSDVDVVRFTCPACRQSTDARIEHFRISLGYIYAAGAPHFCGMIDFPVDGLLAWREGTDLAAELDGMTWRIPATSVRRP
jgi:hypothetical protein